MTTQRLGQSLLVLTAFTALTAIFFASLLPHLSSVLLGPPEDNLQDFWNSWYAARGHDSVFFYTHLIRAPEGVSLYYHSFAYPQVFAVWLLSRIFGTALPTLLLLQNITLLASFPLAATGAFYLCRHLGSSIIGSAAGGFIFAFNPWHIAQTMHHAHVASIEFLPFFALCYLLAVKRKDYRWLAGAAAFYALSALSCWYYFFYCLYFLLFHLLYLRLRDQRWSRGWPLAASALCTSGAILLLTPLIVPMVLSGMHGNAYQTGGNALAAGYFSGNIFTADLLSYLAFPPTHILGVWSKGLYARFTGNAWEDGVYLGLANMALLAWGLWQARQGEKKHLRYALGGMLFFVVLASGDMLHWGGHILPVFMPNIVLSRLPFFANVRTPARAIVFVYLFLSIGVAMAVTTALKHKPTLLKGAALCLALALMLCDFFPIHLESTAFACGSGTPLLAQDRDHDAGVLDMPFGYREANYYMAQQACHGHPIAQGVVARQLAATLADRLTFDDMAAQRRQLIAGRIKYVVLHHPRDGLFQWNADPYGGPDAYRHAYRVIRDSPDETILQVD